MRILFYTPNYLPATRYGGPAFSVHGLASALTSLGHETVVLTTNANGKDLLDVPIGEAVDLDGVKVHYYSINHPRRTYYSSGLREAFQREIRRADMLHINGMFLWPGAYASKVARSLGVPYVVAPRGMLAPELIAAKSSLSKLLWIRFYDRPMLAGAAAIHITSALEERGLLESNLCLSRTFLLPNGVAVPTELPHPDEIDKLWRGVPVGQRIAFLGRLDWKKGVDLAIKAVMQLPYAHLLIAGHDQIGLRRELETQLINEAHRQRIRFIGELSGRRKWAFLRGADVLVVPSLNENFGNVAAEALGVGTMVVCTEGVGAKEIIQRLDPSFVVPRNVDALVRALHSILSNKTQREALAVRARRLIGEEYDWTTIGRKAESIFITLGRSTVSRQCEGQAEQ